MFVFSLARKHQGIESDNNFPHATTVGETLEIIAVIVKFVEKEVEQNGELAVRGMD